jgi:uncharacterized protein YfaP (DUF2135 family)
VAAVEIEIAARQVDVGLDAKLTVSDSATHGPSPEYTPAVVFHPTAFAIGSGKPRVRRNPVEGNSADLTRVSRRELLKRGAALGGAVLWVTPGMQVVGMSRALAQEVSPVPPTGSGDITGQVVDASTAAPIAGATVSVVGTAISTTTDSSGNFLLVGVPAGTQTLEASASGYLTASTSVEVIDGDTVTKVIALSAVSTDQITAVLTWGAIPSDLDLHASGPDGSGGRFHAWYANKTPVPHVELDIDDVTGFGPETMAFKIRLDLGGTFVAGTYRVWVHDYTNRFGTPQWDESNASVVFNGLGGQIAEYLVATAVAAQGGVVEADDDLWRVFQFDLDTAGNISDIVVLQDFVTGVDSTPDV